MNMRWIVFSFVVFSEMSFADPRPLELPSGRLVTLSVSVSQGTAFLRPRQFLSWTITASTSATGSLGLAGFSVDLVQSPFNPLSTDLAPADGVPSAFASFSRPLGISNPAPGQPPSSTLSGYTGTPVGGLGQSNLLQIGGMLNTFGGTGGQAVFGQDFNPTDNTGLGLSGPVVIAAGSFRAPDGTLGQSFSYYLENGKANVLSVVNAPPQASPAVAALAVLGGGISFTVTCPADFDDGSETGTPDGGVTVDDVI